MARTRSLSLPAKAQPFLKWAGGKTRLLGQFEPMFPRRFRSYHEPFIGAGAVFFHLQPQQAHLSDTNPDLVTCYQVIQQDPAGLVEVLRMYRHDRDFYYHVRQLDPRELSPVQRAARMIFLNKTCFNGLWRVNRQGRFNVPFGDYKNPRIVDADNLALVHQALQGVVVRHAGFEQAMTDVDRGDFVYLDPPYHPVSSTARFTSYGADDFREADQRRLAEEFRRLDARGARVMLSNSDTPLIHELYAGFRIDLVSCNRAINRDASKRGAVNEVVVRNY